MEVHCHLQGKLHLFAIFLIYLMSNIGSKCGPSTFLDPQKIRYGPEREGAGSIFCTDSLASSSLVLALLWESRAVDLSLPNCSVTHCGNSLIASGEAHLLPLSRHSSPPCLSWPPSAPPTLRCPGYYGNTWVLFVVHT